jgi:glycosyltransferase involved in cell wall biosynthesis
MNSVTKLGVFVGEDGNWAFFKEIFEDFSAHYQVDVFKKRYLKIPLTGRLNLLLHRRWMRNSLKRNDVCFFEWASELLAAASHMPKAAPIVTRLHSFELADWAHRINWDHVDKIIFVSGAIRDKFVAQFPAHAYKTVIIYNAIPVNKFVPIQRPFDFSLGMLCSIKPIKRIYEVVLMIKELRDDGYSPTLHIGGAPANNNDQDRYYVALRRLVEKLDLQEAVKFYGYVGDPAAWLQKIDIFISNSYWEGMQTALLEAMATGCYCLAHFWDGVEDVLPSENIFVSETDMKDKLIAYSKLSDIERLERKNHLIDVAHQKFDLKDKKIMLREIIESVR